MNHKGERGEFARTRVERIVHEAMLTLAVQPSGYRRVGNGWPEYLHEPDEHGAYPDPDRKERPPWKPTPRHIDELDSVLQWFATWKGRDRKRNGLFKWEYALLEVRATQHLCGKPSWRKIAEAMELVERAPTRSHEWWRGRHDDIIHGHAQ
jgi:hypothetical protein